MCIQNINERASKERKIETFWFYVFFCQEKIDVWIRVLYFPNAFLSFFRFSFDFHSLKKKGRELVLLIENLCIIHWLKRTLGNLKIHALISSFWKAFFQNFLNDFFFSFMSIIYKWSTYVIIQNVCQRLMP